MENHWIFPGMDALVDKHFRQWERDGVKPELNQKPDLRSPLVTISRMLGSGGGAVAENVAASLGCPVYDREIVEEIVKQTHARRHLVDEIDECTSNPVERWLEALVTQEVFDFEDYRKALGEVLESLSRLGPAVILGRGANFLPRPYPRLDVRIIASVKQRVARLVDREHVSTSDAYLLIEKSDRERRKFTRRVYHKEWGDPRHDDLVINTDFVSIEEAANQILMRWYVMLGTKPDIPRFKWGAEIPNK